jgi:hypothetical protein
MRQRFALILFWFLIWGTNKVVQVWFAWCIIFNTKRATEIALAYDRVGNVSMGQGHETISSWSGRKNGWMEPYINKMFEWLGEGPNHCDTNLER